MLEDGYDFEEVAAKLSEGTGNPEGVDLGWVRRGDLSAEVEKIIFSLPPGGCSPPVLAGLTCRIFKVAEKRDAHILEFSEAQHRIESILFQKQAGEKLKAWLSKQKESAYISIK